MPRAGARCGVAAVAEQGVGGVELDDQAAEGVGQHVVSLPGDPGPLLQRQAQAQAQADAEL